MTTSTIIHITPKELLESIREIVRQEMKEKFDRTVTRTEIAEIYGVSVRTVDNWIARGRISRINPEGAHGKYSLNEIMRLKDKL